MNEISTKQFGSTWLAVKGDEVVGFGPTADAAINSIPSIADAIRKAEEGKWGAYDYEPDDAAP